MAAYAIYSACFEKENYFEDFYLCKILSIKAKVWKDLVKLMNVRLRNRIDFVPMVKPMHLIIRVCGRRRIRRNEERAMIEMCENIQSVVVNDIRINTIAALAFWKVCEYSVLYSSKYSNLSDFCRSHEKMEDDGAKIPEIQEYFDVTSDNVRKVFKDAVKPYFNKLLPVWEGRLPSKEMPKIDDDN
jgi:hypothetical protein